MELSNKLDSFLEDKEAHAFLLNGPWGVGKTYSVNEWLKTIDKRGYKVIQLSLFGVSTVEELNALALSSESIRNRIKTYVKSLSQDISVGVGPVSVSVPLIGMVANLLKEKHIKNGKFLFVLDDIERKDNKLTIPEIFGFVDSLPKENTKVILITNTKKLCGGDNELGGFKDKIVQEEYNFTAPTKEATETVFGKKYKIPGFEGKVSFTNLRTIIHAKKVLSKIEKELNETMVKAILLCCLSIWEGKFSKEEYLENYKQDEEGLTILLDKSSKEKYEQDLEKKLLEMQKKEGGKQHWLYENIKILGLLNEIKEDKLREYLDEVFNCVANDNYQALTSINIPLREKPLKKVDEVGAYVFLNKNPQCEYIRIMNIYKGIFLSNEYNLLDSFRKLSQTIMNNHLLIKRGTIGKKAESEVLKMCIEPVARYIFEKIDKDDSNIRISEYMYGSTSEKWFLNKELQIFIKYVSLFNRSFKNIDESHSLDFKAFESKLTVMNCVFDRIIIEKEKNTIQLNQILIKEFRRLIKIQTENLDETQWHHFHELAKFIYDNKGRYNLDKSLEFIKQLSKRRGIVGYRFSILVRTYF